MKVFLMTTLILVFVCGMTFAMIYLFVPRTNINITEDHFSSMVSSFTHSSLDSCKEQLEQFKRDYNVNAGMQALDLVPAGVQQVETVVGQSGKTIHIVDLSEDVEFRALDGYADKGIVVKEYIVKIKEKDCYYYVWLELDDTKVNQITYAFQRLLPWLGCGVLIMSILVSLLYSGYITKPIRTLAGASKKMAGMEDSEVSFTRTDEIGTLAESLGFLYTRLKENILQLESSNKELAGEVEKEREMAEMKQRFFSAVSHELKTPITIVKGQLEGMMGQIGEYKNRDLYLQKSYEVMDKMEGLVQEIIYLSRLETANADTALFAVEQIDFSELIRGQLAEKIELLEKKQMELTVEVKDGIIITADRRSMEKVISNLFGNAIAYSPEAAEIRVRLSKEGDVITFAMENSGVYIEEECISELFNAFYRLEKSRNSGLGGSGLGLYIVKTILDKHEMDYSIQNTETGVRFSFRVRQ